MGEDIRDWMSEDLAVKTEPNLAKNIVEARKEPSETWKAARGTMSAAFITSCFAGASYLAYKKSGSVRESLKPHMRPLWALEKSYDRNFPNYLETGKRSYLEEALEATDDVIKHMENQVYQGGSAYKDSLRIMSSAREDISTVLSRNSIKPSYVAGKMLERTEIMVSRERKDFSKNIGYDSSGYDSWVFVCGILAVVAAKVTYNLAKETLYRFSGKEV
jgi:hypothetical protein